MRSLLTTIIGQCQVRASNTDLVIACMYKAVMRFITSPNAPNCLLMIFIVYNDIPVSLEAGYSTGMVRQRLRAQIHFRHTSYCFQISALTWIQDKNLSNMPWLL